MEGIALLRKYFNKKKIIEELLLECIEVEEEQSLFDKLIDEINEQEIAEDKNELAVILRLISRIVDDHFRPPTFFEIIEQIISTFQTEIKNFFTNYEIFQIFKRNKRILLFLIESKIIIPDEKISQKMIISKYQNKFYPEYFFPEFKAFFDDQLIETIQKKYSEIFDLDPDEFEAKRKNGNNDNYLCQLIQKDSIDDFIIYVNRSNLSLSKTKIIPSIFETNLFLLNNQVSLIEYACFYGSLQIYNYLIMNNIEFKNSLHSYFLWNSAIHGKSSEIFHNVEENYSPCNKILSCYVESIKCHHIDIKDYIKYNLYEKKDIETFSECLRYYNFNEICEEINDESFDIKIENIVYLLSKFNYNSIVVLLLKNVSVDINAQFTEYLIPKYFYLL